MAVASDALNYAKSHAGKAYRADIDGLRAIAVMAVVIYHLKVDALPGGFIGVDIFFVISGYLITGILAHTFAKRTFSLLDFYQRRARRIFPALAIVLTLCLLVGWFFLFPSEYASLGKHVAAGAGFLQNIALWQEAGYFDRESILKPLLHLWSLAVEEQFYIFWPFILWVVLRHKLPLMGSIAAIALASFVLNVASIWQGSSETAFYMPYTRAWELMIGAWLMVAHRQGIQIQARFANLASWSGLGLIVLGFLLIRPEYGFPGFWALLPVVGTALLIHAGPAAFPNRRGLASRPMVWIGLISYPLYLWHWVLWSLGSIIFFSALDDSHHTVRVLRGVVLVLSFLFAWLTYRWLELPIRGHAKAKSAAILTLLVALLGLGGWSVYLAKGFPDRPGAVFDIKAEKLAESLMFSPLVEKCHNLAEDDETQVVPYCVLGDVKGKVALMVHGDSHAMALIPAFDRYGKTRHVRVVFSSQNGCLPLIGTFLDSDYEAPCQRLKQVMESMPREEKISAVVIISRWTEHTHSTTRPDEYRPVFANLKSGQVVEGIAALKVGLKTTLGVYQSQKIPVVLVQDSPQQQDYLRFDSAIRFHASTSLASLDGTAVSLAEHKRNQAEVNRLLESVVAQFPTDSSILNTDAAMCNDQFCPWTKDGLSLYKDDDHLSTAGAMEIYPLLAQHLDRVLGLRAVDERQHSVSRGGS